MFLAHLAWLLPATAAQAQQQDGAPRAVLVTGASSGIGRRITERLASSGLFVYAGARSQQDLDALNAIPNVRAIRLDVTVPRDIEAAVTTITNAKRGLHGVVNNAGVITVAPMIEADERELDFIFGVNVYGPYRITKAFAPLLLESKGRVVNISSLNGIVASPTIGAYSMSKHAVEAFGDVLAAELGRYLVVPAASQADVTIRKVIELLVQLNEGHKFTYDREALIRMLDDALARSRASR